MIEFACRCKHRFAVGDDEAGGVIQCPECGRLNDIPTLDDLPHLDADGAFDIYVERPADDPARLAELGIIYNKGTRDAEGDEIDLRLPASAGRIEAIPLADEEDEPAPRPKYDPETGELIRPLELREDPEAPPRGQAIPLAQPVIGYATAGADFKRLSPGRVLLELFAPGNMMVMAFAVMTWLMVALTSLIVLFGFFFIAFVPIILLGLVIAHYGNVVDEVGPQEQDELPRPLRGVAWHDDIWGPFTQVTGAFLLVFCPLFVAVQLPQPLGFLATWTVVAGGLFFLPAALLTLLTSGTSFNLRPDRLLGVIRASGGHYVVAVVAGVVAIVTSALGFLGTFFAMVNAMANSNAGGVLARWPVAFPMLMLGVYFSHGFAWYLGLMYRAHHGSFPWIMQRHVATRRTSLDPATDVFGRAQRPKRTTEEKLRAAREANAKRFGERA